MENVHLYIARFYDTIWIFVAGAWIQNGYFLLSSSFFQIKCVRLCIDTIPCMLTMWSEWSDCSVTCGKGLRTRQRMLKSPVELGDCTEELDQVEKCMLPECRKL